MLSCTVNQVLTFCINNSSIFVRVIVKQSYSFRTVYNYCVFYVNILSESFPVGGGNCCKYWGFLYSDFSLFFYNSFLTFFIYAIIYLFIYLFSITNFDNLQYYVPMLNCVLYSHSVITYTALSFVKLQLNKDFFVTISPPSWFWFEQHKTAEHWTVYL